MLLYSSHLSSIVTCISVVTGTEIFITRDLRYFYCKRNRLGSRARKLISKYPLRQRVRPFLRNVINFSLSLSTVFKTSCFSRVSNIARQSVSCNLIGNNSDKKKKKKIDASYRFAQPLTKGAANLNDKRFA